MADTFSYRLYFDTKVKNREGTDMPLALENKVDSEYVIDGHIYTVTFGGISFNRKIYQPGEIEAEMFIWQKESDEAEKTDNTIAAVSKLLLNSVVDLYLVSRTPDGTEDSKLPIAKNYYVYELDPRLVKQADKSYRLFVRLLIYSMDKLMTLEKSSKTFVAKKLGSGILAKEALKYKVGDHVLQENHDFRQLLRYNQKAMAPNGATLDIPSEMIQPYLVQYNESFYDFMVRTANRCGEFLFYEDGKLNLGLPVSGAPKEIEGYASVTYQRISGNGGMGQFYSRDSMKDGAGQTNDTNYNRVGRNSAGFPRDLFPQEGAYHSELSSDEYFFPLTADKFTSQTREMGYEGGSDDIVTSQAFPTMAKAMASSEGADDFVKTIAADKLEKQASSKAKVEATNKAGKEKYIDKYNKTEFSDGNQTVPFSSTVAEGWTTLSYYNAIHRYEEELLKHIVCIDMSSNIEDVKLGQMISLSGNIYIVIQIIMSGEDKWSNEYETYEADASDSKNEGRLSQKIFAVPLATQQVGDQVIKKPFPPLYPVPFIRHSEPQTAFITDNQDPKYQGRVRIVFPWQPEFEEARNLTLSEVEYAKSVMDLAEKMKKLSEEQAKIKPMETEMETLKKGKIMTLISKGATIQALQKKIDEEKDDPKKENEVKALTLMKAQLEAQAKQFKDMSTEEFQTYTENYKKALKAQKALVEKLKKDLEASQKQVEQKKQSLETAVVVYKKKLIDISTPWIRVATPMATDGGGAFFKPMIGDEVLVNFEGGNVERPYVVGSLFSKNTLAPDERINRTVGPNLHADASIAIVSPNGHGITFNDPTSADDFVSSVFPALGVVTNLVPMNLPKSKDLAGGIRIGDRYGLYSIDMSADQRSVSISSSLGDVKLDAYSGITITAPNGDVKIAGKNVTIEAGNNLSLTSGNNIKKKTDTATLKGKLASKADSVVDKASEMAADKLLSSPLDVALFRTVLETFLKPIEGTMLVKSKRYLKLEAGEGKTVINQNRYKDWDFTKKERLAKSQDFFKMMNERVSLLDARLNEFVIHYCAMWMDAYNKKVAYLKAENELFKIPAAKDLIKKAFDLEPEKEWEGNEFKVDDLKDAKLKKIRIEKGTIIKLRSDEDRKSDILPLANTMGEAIHVLRKHLESFATLFDDMGEVGHNYIDKSLKEAFQGLKDDIIKKVKTDYGTDLKNFLQSTTPDDSMVKNKMINKRKLAAIFVAKVAGHPDHKTVQLLTVKYKEGDVTDDKAKDNYLWGNLMTEIGDATMNPLLKSMADHIMENASKALSLDQWKEIVGDREVWDDRKGGQILFSDDENSTVNFDRGALNVERGANSYNMDRLKQLLTGLKD